MVSQISGSTKIHSGHYSDKKTTTSKKDQTQSTSIFDSAKTQTEKTKKEHKTHEKHEHKTHDHHGKGLGAGQIPPGLQRKIDSGKSLPEKLIAKFKQLFDALNPKEEATPAPVITDPIVSNQITPLTTPIPVVSTAPTAQQVAVEDKAPVTTDKPALPADFNADADGDGKVTMDDVLFFDDKGDSEASDAALKIALGMTKAA